VAHGAAATVNHVFFFVTVIFALGLALLLFWALRGASSRKGVNDGLEILEKAPRHVSNMSQIRQALDAADLQFAAEKGGPALAVRVRLERRHVMLLYLAAIRQDFDKLLRIARIVALLSPEVSSSHEFDRLRLSAIFRVRFEWTKLRLLMGSYVLPQTDMLGQMVATLATQTEMAMVKLGERAALAAELAVQSER
jgi:hypothetical protein